MRCDKCTEIAIVRIIPQNNPLAGFAAFFMCVNCWAKWEAKSLMHKWWRAFVVEAL